AMAFNPGSPAPGAAVKVHLSAADVTWAAQSCQRLLPNLSGEAQWQQFLSALALKGLEQWLWSCGLRPQPTLWPPIPSGESLCRVKNCSLGLVVQSSLSEDTVSLPLAAPGLEQGHADFYILVEVREEMNQVVILAGLQYNPIKVFGQGAAALELRDRVPVDAFDQLPTQILRHLLAVEELMNAELA
ncbi:MAG TPA: DUF1822 family protein, partial [Trichocoleus sp.]